MRCDVPRSSVIGLLVGACRRVARRSGCDPASALPVLGPGVCVKVCVFQLLGTVLAIPKYSGGAAGPGPSCTMVSGSRVSGVVVMWGYDV